MCGGGMGNPRPEIPPPTSAGACLDNNILTQGAVGRALTPSETLLKVVIIMSTYEELNLIVSVALLIVTILNFTHKK